MFRPYQQVMKVVTVDFYSRDLVMSTLLKGTLLRHVLHSQQ